MINFEKYKRHYIETLHLGLPIMIGQLGIIIVGFADNIMVGHHSTPELAAASFVNNIFNLVFIFSIGFSYGLTPIIGEIYARKHYKEAGETLKNSLFINFILSLLLSTGMFFLLIHINIFKQPDELISYIKPYYILQLISIIFTLLFNSFKQFCDGTTDTITPMWIMLGCNIINIVGNYIFIFGNCGAPELGLTGAGISTLSSRIISLLIFIYLFITHSRFKKYQQGFFKGKINKSSLKRLIHLGLPVGFQMGVETASFSLSVIMMGWIGSTALAAHQVLSVITTLGFMVYYGIAAAVSIRISRFKGLKDGENIKNSALAGLHLIMFIAILVILFILIFRKSMGYLITPEKEVVDLVAILSWSVIFYQFGDGLQILYSNALRGISDVKYMAIIAFICHFFIALPLGYLCGFIFNWGAIGVWCGFPVSLTTLGVLLWQRFNKLSNMISYDNKYNNGTSTK